MHVCMHACAHTHAHTHIYISLSYSFSAPPSLSCTHIVSLSPSSPHHHSRPMHSCSLSLWAIMRQLKLSGSINAHISCGVWILQKSYWQSRRVITEKIQHYLLGGKFKVISSGFHRVQSLGQSCSHCTLSPSLTWYVATSVIITNTLMIPSCQRGLLPISFSLFSVISRPALKVL